MSEYVLISDIHGNAPALRSVIDREGFNAEYVFLGDLMGLMSYPKDTVDIIRQLQGHVLAGNHDKAIFHHGEGHVNSDQLSAFEFNHTMEKLSYDDIEWMRRLPFMEVWQDGSARIAAAHAIPWPEKASGYEAGNAGVPKGNVPHFASIVADDYDFVFVGHSHEQFSLDASRWGHDVHFVNPGTLGYEDRYAVVNTETGNVSLKQVESTYDEVKSHIKEVLPSVAPSVEMWL